MLVAIAGAQPGDACAIGEHVFAIQQDSADRMLARIEIIDPVERTQQRRFAAPRRPDQRSDPVALDREVHVEQRLALPVEEIQPARLEHQTVRGRRGDRVLVGGNVVGKYH